ncbi:MAG: sialidase family protein, partial [Armatimonadetes bacterium]|nr:sialidase family protein [Armatimonadota bacterium]
MQVAKCPVITLSLLLSSLILQPSSLKSDVYVSGAEGYHTFRIPVVITTSKGTLLALCEGRKNSAADDGDIDLVLKRSEDEGRTWGPMHLIHEEGGDAEIT